MDLIRYASVSISVDQVDFDAVAQLMYWLMLRNMSGDGISYVDPDDASVLSLPGCIVASPSYPRDGVSSTTQNYVYNWTRDSAIAATEIALTGPSAGDTDLVDRLRNYVSFAEICQANSPNDLAHATYTLNGLSWSGRGDQNDGPAFQALALFFALPLLPPDAQAVARRVAQANVEFIVERYQDPSTNEWEEISGQSFLTRAVQLRCLRALQADPLGLTLPANLDKVVADLTDQLATHWDEANGYYRSVLDPNPERGGYDPNADIVMASVYGAVSCTDPKLLATAAKIRAQCAAFPVNQADSPNLGPLIGRYPGDTYDGDNQDPGHPHADTPAHPWALCSANFAEFYYVLAAALVQDGELPTDPLAAPFFADLQIDPGSDAPTAAGGLCLAGDRILKSLVRHSDHLALSEQFDASTGYEKSVRDLSWSYAAFLSAVRARNRLPAAVRP
jgi:glucoamylase